MHTPQVECERHHTTLYVTDVLAQGFSVQFVVGDVSYRFVERPSQGGSR